VLHQRVTKPNGRLANALCRCLQRRARGGAFAEEALPRLAHRWVAFEIVAAESRARPSMVTMTVVVAAIAALPVAALAALVLAW
jgi:hypothetical protein